MEKTICNTCGNEIKHPHLETNDTDKYWEVSLHCENCGSFQYSYNVYKVQTPEILR